jgi:hypothetical protein
MVKSALLVLGGIMKFPNATLASFADLGHVPQEEAPAESLQPVEKFLCGVGA